MRDLVPEVVAQSADRQGLHASGADVAQIAPFDVDAWDCPIPEKATSHVGTWYDLNVVFSPW